MDEINEIKKAIRHENWKQMYEEYLNSGMTVKDLCGAQGIISTASAINNETIFSTPPNFHNSILSLF